MLSFSILLVLNGIPQYAQSSVTPVTSSESQDVIPAFSASGPITLPVMRRLIDVNYANGKKERADLLVVFEPGTGHYFWRHSVLSSPNDTSGWLATFKSRSSAIYVTPNGLVEFLGGSNLIEHRSKANSLGNAESASIDEVRRNLSASQRIRSLLGVSKLVPILDAPRLVGFEKYPQTNRLPGFVPIPREFICGGVSYRLGDKPCPHGTLVVSISKQGENWRLVLRNRWDVEIILDPNFNAVSSKQLTAPPK
jgi:hypothetical protein